MSGESIVPDALLARLRPSQPHQRRRSRMLPGTRPGANSGFGPAWSAGGRFDPVQERFDRDADEPDRGAVIVTDERFADIGEEGDAALAANPELALPAAGPAHAPHDVLRDRLVLGPDRQFGDRATEHLDARPAVKPLGTSAPVRHHPDEVRGDDRE